MDSIVLGKDFVFPANPDLIHRNLNTMIIGGSGSGKTFSIVQPTLQKTSETSLVISDPKGSLVKRYEEYFRRKGYKVEVLDFIDPGHSTFGFDPFQMISNANDQDIMSLAHMLLYDPRAINSHADPFWNQMAEVLLSSLLSYVLRECYSDERDMSTVIYLTNALQAPSEAEEDSIFGVGFVAELMEKVFNECYEANKVEPFHLRQWKKVHMGASRTIMSIYVTLQSLMGRLDSEEMTHFFQNKNQISPKDLLHRKTVVFVKCSDVDPSLYFFINAFYMILMKELFRICDASDERDTIPVRFILDDFAATVSIQDLPLWISTMRERKISVTMILQSITQLESRYGRADARTIIANCDNIVYLHSNDFDTASEFAKRIGITIHDLLYLPINEEYVLVSGQEPVRTTRYDMRNDDEYKLVQRINQK